MRRGYGQTAPFCACAGAITALGAQLSAYAQEWTTNVRVGPDPPTQEVWAGFDVGPHWWSAYSGVTIAPFGPLTADGWRLRIAGGYGRYDYRTVWALSHKRRTFDGTVSFAEALAGYQRQWRAITVKALVGAAAETQAVWPPDPDNSAVGYELGLKAAFEAWVELSPHYWSSLDLSWSSVFDSYYGRLRAGWRVEPDLSIGLEAAAMGNVEYDGGRGGAFLRYTWPSGEISLSGGAAASRALDVGAYATLNVLYRY